MMLANSALPLEALRPVAATVSTFLLTMALGAMGLETDLARLRAKGVRPLVLGALAWLFISGFGLALILL